MKLDVDLRAEDFLGETLAVSGNAPIPPGAWFTWQGAGDPEIQRAKYVATDNYGQHAICEFSVLVGKQSISVNRGGFRIFHKKGQQPNIYMKQYETIIYENPMNLTKWLVLKEEVLSPF